MPKALWDIVWKRLRESHDFLTYAPDGADRVVVPLSELQEDHVERLDDAVKMLASQETQEAYVGVYANRVQRNAYSEMQIKSLAQLTTWGVEGLPQSELTKQMESKGEQLWVRGQGADGARADLQQEGDAQGCLRGRGGDDDVDVVFDEV